MNKKIIVIGGYCATGKTTFAARLSKEFSVPYFAKDMVKIALDRSFGVQNRADSKRLSAIAFDSMAFAVERFMEAGQPIIIEANFVMRENHGGLKEGETLRELIDRYGYQSLTYIFTGDLPALYKRFAARDVLPSRGVANQMWGEFTYQNYLDANLHLVDFNIGGEIVRIDATDLGAVDFCKYIKVANKFLEG